MTALIASSSILPVGMGIMASKALHSGQYIYRYCGSASFSGFVFVEQ
jgi:hypothetical protein